MKVISNSAELREGQVDKKFTLANIASVGRGLGGIALGASLGVKHGLDVDWKVALGTAAGFAASDAEGTFINIFKKLPKKISDHDFFKASTYGVRWDVYGDKAFMLSLLAGGVAGGYIPEVSLSLLAPEATTAVTSLYAGRKLGSEPEVKTVGKVGMIARFAEIGAYLTAYTLKDEAPKAAEILTNTGYGLTATALGLGFASCYTIYKQGREIPEITSPAIDIIQQTNGPRQLAVAV